jgi:hypothetical protein
MRYTERMLMFTLKKILGVFCLVFGLFALVTPLTPGAWLIFVGIELLGLTFLLPHPIRSRWDLFKIKLKNAWHRWTRRQK